MAARSFAARVCDASAIFGSGAPSPWAGARPLKHPVTFTISDIEMEPPRNCLDLDMSPGLGAAPSSPRSKFSWSGNRPANKGNAHRRKVLLNLRLEKRPRVPCLGRGQSPTVISWEGRLTVSAALHGIFPSGDM